MCDCEDTKKWIFRRKIHCYKFEGNQIGSFGNQNQTPVAIENVWYRDCFMDGTDVGAQIKTHPNNNGFVRNLTFESFHLNNVLYPTSIDFFWCPHTTCPPAIGKILMTDISFIGFNNPQGHTNVARPVKNI